ncbi:MAG: DUF4199 domain-containing protein [Bacteroidales bacterium]|jgi:hypothetical protein|nr:DUF4199 domain-containing protein [Bacteroidales bacterium]
MENKSNSVFKAALNYGLMLGLALVIYAVLLFIFDLHLNKYLGYISYIIVIAFLIWGTKSYRDNNLNGAISYGKALGLSTLIVLIAAFIYGIYSYLLITVIDPGYIDKLIAISEEQLLKQGIPDEQIEIGLSMQKKMMSPMIISILAFVGMFFWGFVLSLIISAFMKKEGDPYQSAMQDIEDTPNE